jgi:hypothetical protein
MPFYACITSVFCTIAFRSSIELLCCILNMNLAHLNVFVHYSINVEVSSGNSAEAKQLCGFFYGLHSYYRV